MHIRSRLYERRNERSGLLYEKKQASILNNRTYKHFESYTRVPACLLRYLHREKNRAAVIRGIQSARADYDK